MKFYATLKVETDGKVAGDLIRAFFEDFNQDSTILIKDNEAKLEIAFDEGRLPKTIANAIAENSSQIIELSYGEKEQENSYDEVKKMSKTKPNKVNNYPKKSKNLDEVEITEISDMASTAKSFSELVDSVSSWLDIESWAKDFFKGAIIAASRLEDKTWKAIISEMEKDNVEYSNGKRHSCTKKISIQMQKCGYDSVTPLDFIKILSSYDKKMSIEAIASEETPEKVEEQEIKASEEITENVESEESVASEEVVNSTEKPIKLSCFETLNIPELELTLSTLRSKYGTKVEMVREVFKIMRSTTNIPMSANDMEYMSQKIGNAMNYKIENLDSIFGVVDTEMRLQMSSTEMRLQMSKFINDFAHKYNPNIMVKVIDFIKDLQKVILEEDEYKRIYGEA